MKNFARFSGPASRSSRRSGFTLVELLVTIAVAAVLMTMAIVSYQSAQRGARDSKRKKDMDAIQVASEQYFGDYAGLYPTSAAQLGAYFPAGVPTDPKATQSYSQTLSATAYCWCATMETTNSGNSGAGCNLGGGKTHYCVSQRQ